MCTGCFGRWLGRNGFSRLHPSPTETSSWGEHPSVLQAPPVGDFPPDPVMTTCLDHVLGVPVDTWVPRLLLVGDLGEPSLTSLTSVVQEVPRWGWETGELYKNRDRGFLLLHVSCLAHSGAARADTWDGNKGSS